MKRFYAPTKMVVIAVSVMCMVAACAKPQTARPYLDKGAIAHETGVQKQIAQQAQPPVENTNVPPSYSEMTLVQMQDRLQDHGRRVKAAGMKLCQITGRDPNSCNFSFTIKDDKVLNAYADGKSIYVTPVMMQFAKNDDTLGMVLSHEYAHNIMGHVASKQKNAIAGLLLGGALDMLAKSQGVDTGGKLGNLGASQGANAYSPAFESEADYVGMYVMYYAGYDISNAASLWRHMTAADPKGAFMATTHPANPERYVLLNQTKDEIFAKRDVGQPIVPSMKKKK